MIQNFINLLFSSTTVPRENVTYPEITKVHELDFLSLGGYDFKIGGTPNANVNALLDRFDHNKGHKDTPKNRLKYAAGS